MMTSIIVCTVQYPEIMPIAAISPMRFCVDFDLDASVTLDDAVDRGRVRQQGTDLCT